MRSAERSGVQRRSLWQEAASVVRQTPSCKEKPSSEDSEAWTWLRTEEGLQLFRFWEEVYRKNDFLCQQKRKLLRIGFMWTNLRVAKCRQSKKLSVAQKSFSSNIIHK